MPTSFRCLHLRAVRSLLLMRTLTDATVPNSGMELTSLRVAQTKPNCEQQSTKKQIVFLSDSDFSAEKKFYREHHPLFCKLRFYCRGKQVFDENHMRFGAHGLCKSNFKRPKKR